MYNWTLWFYWAAILLFSGWTWFNPINGVATQILWPKIKSRFFAPKISGQTTLTWKQSKYRDDEEVAEWNGMKLRVNTYDWNVECVLPGIGKAFVSEHEGILNRTRISTLQKKALAEEAAKNLVYLGATGIDKN